MEDRSQAIQEWMDAHAHSWGPTERCYERHPVEGEACACGRPATVVHVAVDNDGKVTEMPRCRGRVGAWLM
jgi:hypothetical protein